MKGVFILSVVTLAASFEDAALAGTVLMLRTQRTEK